MAQLYSRNEQRSYIEFRGKCCSDGGRRIHIREVGEGGHHRSATAEAEAKITNVATVTADEVAADDDDAAAADIEDDEDEEEDEDGRMACGREGWVQLHYCKCSRLYTVGHK